MPLTIEQCIVGLELISRKLPSGTGCQSCVPDQETIAESIRHLQWLAGFRNLMTSDTTNVLSVSQDGEIKDRNGTVIAKVSSKSDGRWSR